MTPARGVNDEHVPARDDPDRGNPRLAVGPAIVDAFEHRALENPAGVLEIDPVLGRIGGVLARVPLEAHTFCIYDCRYVFKGGGEPGG